MPAPLPHPAIVVLIGLVANAALQGVTRGIVAYRGAPRQWSPAAGAVIGIIGATALVGHLVEAW